MPRIPLTWLGDHVELAPGADAEAVAASLVSVGLEEEAIFGAQVTGPLVVGRVLDMDPQPQKNGKTINWCRVDVGPEHDEAQDNPKDPQPGPEQPSRGIICGAHNFGPGDLVVVALPGTVLPGPFPIAARKTYGHLSDGMICSTAELGLGEGTGPESEGIIVLGKGSFADVEAQPGDDAIALLGLGEQVVEINVTPDRGYAFSMRGVAREYSHATGQPFTDPLTEIAPAQGTAGIPVQLDDDAPIRANAGCTRFVAVEVRGVDPSAPSPRWMQQRLTLAGMRPISLVVDVTNYVMLDLGQPLHAYDARSLVGPVIVRRAKPGETLETLDDAVRTLDPEDLVIADCGGPDGSDRAIGLAGVMGGASTEVSGSTSTIIIEAATFDQVTVARTARRHRLSSEASKRFERGVDPRLPAYAAQRAAELIVQYGGGEIDPRVTDVRLDGVDPDARRTVELPLGDAERIVGIAYTPQQVRSSLETIGCEVEGEDPLLVTVPTWRPDLRASVDLVEEIARLVGYERIPSVLPQAPGGRGLTRAQARRRHARRALAELGLTEVASYPFVGEGVFDRLGFAPDDPRRRAVRLVNPLADDEPLLRTDLLETLIPVARRNLGRGAESIAIFQTGKVFEAREGAGPAPVPGVEHAPDVAELAAIARALPVERLMIAGVIGGARGPESWYGSQGQADWSDAVDAALRVGAAVGAHVRPAQAEHAPYHPGRCAAIELDDGTVIGYAGELHPRVVKEYGLPARTGGFQLDLDALISSAPGVIRAEPVSSFPVAKEDFAFVVDRSVPASAVEAAIVIGIGDLLESVRLFDVFEGDQIGEGKKSLAFSVRLRSEDGTLTAEQIGEARQRCIAAVSDAVGGVLRA